MKRLLVYAPYVIVALVIVWPLLAPGYVLTLDMVVAPPFPDWLQKLAIVGFFAIAGIGAHRLFISLWQPRFAWPAYFAGLVYMMNPFVYSRFMAGQYLVLLGYMLLPFFVRAWVLFVRRPDWRKATLAGVWLGGVGLVSIHTFGMAILAAVILGAALWWPRRTDKSWRQALVKYSSLTIGVALLLSSFWFVPALLGHGRTVTTVAEFNSADFAAFATRPDGFGWLGNVLALQGFWADGSSLYLVPKDLFEWWWLPWLAVWALVGLGIYKSWHKQRGLTLGFVALIIIAAILAIGTAGTIAAPFNDWLLKTVPFFAGYREPQKFVALIALAYAYFGAAAVAWLAEKVKLWTVPLFALPLLMTPLLPGFYGQLTPRQYPADWFEVNAYLQKTDPTAKVLFLPWHLYMPFKFADGRDIANPTPRFFKNPVVISNDPEMAGAKSDGSTSEQLAVQALIPVIKQGDAHLAADLRVLNIRYVILAKELDYKRYESIELEDGITLVRETATLKLYAVTH